MRRRFLIIAAVALVAAIATTAFFYNLLSDSLGSGDGEVAQRPVVVAARDLARGTRISPDDLAVEQWPENEIPAGAREEKDSLEGTFLVSSLPAGKPVLPINLPRKGKGGLAAAIPPGMRAVSVHVDGFGGVNGILDMGDRVDVLVADAARTPGRADINLRTLINNVEVLATGRDPDHRGRPLSQAEVTVLVEVKDAEALSLADQAGSIRLTLRNPIDEGFEVTKGVSHDEVFLGSESRAVRSRRSARKAPRPAPKPIVPEPPKLSQTLPSAASSHVLIDLRFAGLSDDALGEFTARLDDRITTGPMIVSTFRRGWDVGEPLAALSLKKAAEVFAEPSFRTLSLSEARFEKLSQAPFPGGGGQGELQAMVDPVGVTVRLIPELLPSGLIRMKILSESAIPDPDHPVQIGGVSLPRVSLRRAECEIEIAEGQSFWIRGLIDRPGAWDFLRRLFPQRPLLHDANDELVIFVTSRRAPPQTDVTEVSVLIPDERHVPEDRLLAEERPDR